MWSIAKYKSYEYHLFTESMRHELPNCKIFRPLFKKGKRTICLLGNYCFLYHRDLDDEDILNKLKYKRGVNYFLGHYKSQQQSIQDFIDYLQKNMESEGVLNPKFFFQYLSKQGVFLEGPLKSLIFNVLEKHKKSLKITIEGMCTPMLINKERVTINFL